MASPAHVARRTPRLQIAGTLIALFSLAGVVEGGGAPAFASATAGSLRGQTIHGAQGITESVALLQQRAALLSAMGPRPHEQADNEEARKSPDRHVLPQNPAAPAVTTWPPRPVSNEAGRSAASRAPQAISGVNFRGGGFNDKGLWPPDSMGDVGPTQYVVAINNVIRSFNKDGTPDNILNIDPDSFFTSVSDGTGTTDPRIRYDRLSQRWFITMITLGAAEAGVPGGANRWMLAVSSGPTITSASNFTFFQFTPATVSPKDGGQLADYPTLGIDKNALYVGMDMFDNFLVGTSVYVIQKSSVLGNGSIVVTGFSQVAMNGFIGGPYAPQGVTNEDPGQTATTPGWFIGVTFQKLSDLTLRRVDNSGSGSPTLSANITITVPATQTPTAVPYRGNTGSAAGLDSLDDRLMNAVMRDGKIWTAQTILVNSSGVGSASGDRNASRWYQLDPFGTTVTNRLVQAGTIFDGGAGPQQYWIPTVNISGQKHVAFGFSAAGTNYYPDAATAGRLATDPPGTQQATVRYTTASSNYAPSNLGSQVTRWGDYSNVGVDPNDDMTFWTVQEYVDATDSYAVRVAKLLAPPPATPSSASPASIGQGVTTDVTITGTTVSGSGFFDPGAGFPNHLTASVSGGVTVNHVTYSSPTSVTLNVSTGSASTGPKMVTVTNPDGQSASASILSVTSGVPHPALNVSPASISFGAQGTGTTSGAQSALVSNTGDTTVNISGVSITGANPGDFNVSGCGVASLAAGASCSLNVTFAPQATGSRAATVLVNDDAPGSPHTVTLSGTGVTSAVVLSASSLTFPDTRTSTTSPTQTVSLTNATTSNVSVSTVALSGTNAADFTKAGDTCTGAALAPSTSCTVGLAFTPSATGVRTASLTFTDTGPGSPRVVSLSGNGVAPLIAVTPSSLSFGNQRVGIQSPALQVSVDNTGSSSIVIGNAILAGTNAMDFAVAADSCSNATVAAGAHCNISIAFLPTAAGPRSGTLSIPNDAGASLSVALSGTGTQSVLGVSPLTLDFPTTQPGGQSGVQTITLTNSGTATLNIGTLTFGGASPQSFVKTSDPCSHASLAQGGTCAVGIAFAPGATGTLQATLSVPSDAPGGPAIVRLSGTGATAPISATPGSVSFGNQTTESTSSIRDVSVRNDGSGPLTMSGLLPGGYYPSDYTIVDGCTGKTLPSGGTCALHISFKPSGVGARPASFGIETSAGEIGLPLNGTGVGPQLTPDPTALAFGVIRVGARSGAQTISIRNDGNGALSGAGVSLAGAQASDFILASDRCSARTVAPGTSCSVTINFGPQAAGARNAQLVLQAPGGVALGIPLSGIGDGVAPSSSFSTTNGTTLVSGNAVVSGAATDDYAGVTSARVTFTDDTSGLTYSSSPSLGCNAARTYCRWQVVAPFYPGSYTVGVRATDAVGNAETPGPTIGIIVI